MTLLPPNGGFFLLCSLSLTTVFTVNDTPCYYVAYLDQDGRECYGNSYDTREEAESFAALVDGAYVVLRGPLDF